MVKKVLHLNSQIVAVALSMAALSVAAPATMADDSSGYPDYPADAIVIRQTIPYPNAVKRAPLTSDQLSTASTRLIDARRGLRPYSTVHGTSFGHHHGQRVLGQQAFGRTIVGYDDHFGVTRAENRPYSYMNRTPATGVTQYTNTSTRDTLNQTQFLSQNQAPLVIRTGVIQTTRQEPRPDMTVRIHNDKPTLPSRSGAVLILRDGTVIQVGD